MSIPEPIQKAMARWSNDYSGHIKYLGKYQGRNAYTYGFEDNDLDIGFPVVYILNGDNTVEEIGGFESFKVLNSLV